MKNVKFAALFCIFLIIPCAVFAQDAQEMMGPYKQMGEGTAKNFPKDLEELMPKGFSIENKGFVFKETANMFLFITP